MRNLERSVLAVLLCALPTLTPLAGFAEAFSEQRLQQACAVLQQAPSPLEAAELQVLADTSRSATNSLGLRSRAMAAYSLTFLMKGDTNAFERAVRVIQASCPEAAPHIKVTADDCFTLCTDCLGSGNQRTLCPVCMGSGNCKACAGTGRKGEATCTACKGKGLCGMCAGKRRITTPCPVCKGSTRIFKPKADILANFKALLAEIIALCQENARFAEQFQQASKETDPSKRVTLFRDLIQAFPRRKDLGPALALLEKSVNAQKSEESRLRAQEKREREEREKTALLELRGVRVRELDAAIAQLRAYLDDHPSCSGYLELKVLEDELVARRNRAQLMRKILYGTLAVIGVFALARVLVPLLFRKKPERSGPLPGMANIDKADFTDPLALTAKDSRARAKHRTARIPPPGDANRSS